MVRRYLRGWSSRGWGWGLRSHHIFGAGFLASAVGMYPIAASIGLAPNTSTVASWFSSNAPAIKSEVESEIQSAAKDPTEYGKSLPGKIVSVVESLGAQAAAANGRSVNFQPSPNPNVASSPSLPTSNRGFAPTSFAPAPAYPTSGYPQAAYPPSGYPQGGYPQGGYPAGNPYAYSAGYINAGTGTGDISCYFSPSGGCTEAVVNEIRQAQQQILVQAYSFTSVPIANALVEAHNRGVAVYVVLDKSQKSEQYSSADFVSHAGIPTLIDSAHAIAHNKVMLIDRQTIITGSFNFTTSAEKSNAENLLIIRNRPDLYQSYENNFRHHYEHSQPYQGRATAPSHPTHSYMPTTNYAQGGYPPNGGYQPSGGNQPNVGYQASGGYQPSAGYQPNAGYQQGGGYPAVNPYESGNNSYPQTASPANRSGGYRY
jgi:hypothetical protein